MLFRSATTSGIYSIRITSDDGCWIDTDSIYAQIYPPPPLPLITDDHGVNIQAAFTLPVLICAPDSVILTSNLSSNYTLQWDSEPINNPQITVTTFGATYHYLEVMDSLGCTNANSVQVIIFQPLQQINPALICLNDADGNDTIRICYQQFVTMFAFDQ